MILTDSEASMDDRWWTPPLGTVENNIHVSQNVGMMPSVVKHPI